MATKNPEAQVPPHDLDVERTVLGSMIEDGSVADELRIWPSRVPPILALLRPEDFYSEAHQNIFETIRHLDAQGRPADLVSVYHQIKEWGLLEEVGGAAYISSLQQYVFVTANAVHHAKIVKEMATKRAVHRAALEALEGLHKDPLAAAGNLEDKCQTMRLAMEANEIQGLDDIVTEVAQIEERREKEIRTTGLPTGLRHLDDVALGLQNGDLILVAARPSVGKSALALNLALHTARAGKAVLMFSIEMSRQQINRRLLSLASSIPLRKIREADLNDKEAEKLSRAAEDLQLLPLLIDTRAKSLEQIQTAVRECKQARPDLALIIVDYVQRIHGSAAAKRQGTVAEMSEVSGAMQQITQDMELPVVALSQLSRDIDKQFAARKPKLSDLKWSGALEEDADLVIFIHRMPIEKERDIHKPNEPVRALLIVAKHRNGPTGEVEVLFVKQLTRFTTLKKEEWDLDAWK